MLSPTPHWVAFDQAPDQGDALFVGETPHGRWYPVLSENANGAESSNPGDVLALLHGPEQIADLPDAGS